MVLRQTNAKEIKDATRSVGGRKSESTASNSRAQLKTGMLDFLAGESKEFVGELTPYLPQEMVGGSVPHIPGTEDEAVWNAASQACSTERVHYCYSIDDGRVWYLACASSQLASNPDSWCPLAAALPGNSEYWDRETVYIYEQEGVASALRWDPETSRMQVYLGAARTILPRIQTMDANFVTIKPEVADVVRWKNRALRIEKLSRMTARMLIMTGLFLNFFIISILGMQLLLTHNVERDLSRVTIQTQEAVGELMKNAASTMQNDSIRHMINIQELLDALIHIDGTLIRYEAKGSGRGEWEALIPQAYSNGVGIIKGAVQPKIEPDGRVRIIGKR